MLHLQAHTTPYNFGAGDFLGTTHKWLDRFVYDINNGIDTNDIDVWVANSLTGEVHTYPKWPATPEGKDFHRYYFGQTKKGGGQLLENAPAKAQEAPFADALKYRNREGILNPADPFYNTYHPAYSDVNNSNWWYGIEGYLQGAWEATMLFPSARPTTPNPGGTGSPSNTNVTVDKDELLTHSNARLAYVSEPLTEPVTLSGNAKVTLNITPSRGTGSISAMIVDLGDARRSYQTTQTVPDFQIPAFANTYTVYNRFEYTFANTITPYKVVARSSVDVQNPNPSGVTYMDTHITRETGFVPEFYYQTAKIEPGKSYSYTFALEPRHYTFREGSRLAVVIYSTDYRHTIRPHIATEFTLELGEGSYIDLPLMNTLPTPITSLKIDARVTETVARGGVYNFGLLLNEGAKADNIVWTLSDPSFALIDDKANIHILNKTGTVRLIATDPESGLYHSITLRIAS